MDAPQTTDSQQPPLWWLIALCLLITLNWLAVLRWGLTIDETGTFAIAKDGLREALHRAWDWTGQSVLYSAIASFFCLPISHGRDFILRLPAICGVIGAAFQLFHFAEEQNGEGSGWPSTLILCSFPPVWSYGLFARPYGLILFACVVSNRMLWRWRDTRRTKFLIFSWLSLAGCVYLHVLTILMAILQIALVAAWVIAGRQIDWKKYAVAALAFFILLMPVYLQNLSLAGKAAGWQFTEPSIRTLWEGIPLKLCVAALAVVLCGAALVRGRRMLRPVTKASDALWLPYLIAWWLVPAAVFFLLHEWRGMELLHSRYLLFTTPALSLLAGRMALHLSADVRLTALGLLLAIVLVPGRLLEPQAEADFRAARDFVNAVSGSELPPLLAPTWYVEGRRTDIDQAAADMPYLFSYLDAYPVSNPVYRMPRMFEEAYSKKRFIQLIDGKLHGQRRFLVGPAWAPLEPWVFRELKARSWKIEIHYVNSIEILVCVNPYLANPREASQSGRHGASLSVRP
jgi:hypothetical protein